MTTYVWLTIRTRLSQTFKTGPTANQEDRITTVFAHSPAAIDQLANEVETAYKHGTVHSPWGLLATKAQRLEAGKDLNVDDTSERDRAVKNTERWIRNTGLYLHDQTELEDELFGDHGRLRLWATDTKLRHRLIELWQQQRPRGKTAEQAATQYQEKAGTDYLKHHPANRPAATENP